MISRQGYHGILFGLLIAVVLLLIYGSLYPWHFYYRELPHSPVYILFHSWGYQPGRRFVSDVIINIVIYVPLGVTGYLAMRKRLSAAVSIGLTILLGFCLSAAIEMTQLYTLGRVCQSLDLANNTIGSVLGALAALVFARHTDAAVTQRRAAADKGAVFLLAVGISWLLFPLYPALSLAVLLDKIASFARGSIFGAGPILIGAATWLAAGRLLVAARLKEAPVWLTFGLVLLLVQFGVVGRYPIPAEWLGAVIGMAIFRVLSHYWNADLFGAWLLLGAITLRSLLPLRISEVTGSFHWMPFSIVLGYDWQASMGTLMGKAYQYGAALWLFHRGGWRWFSSTLLLVMTLAVLEAMQTRIPDHVAESTDPILALMLAGVLAVLSGTERVPRRTSATRTSAATSRSR